MIENEDIINKLENFNKIYIPQDYYNENYKYTLDNNDTITIITNQDCYMNYNTQYCDCMRYNMKNNIVLTTYSCNTNPSTQNIIKHENITQDINYNERIKNEYTNEYIINYGIIIIAILTVIVFKKNSRRI